MDSFIMQLVIASRNVHKIREYKEMLSELVSFDILSLLDFPDYRPEEERFDSFKKNAETKAINAAKKLNKIVLADDSGLVVPALDGEPGIYSARYAGKSASDADNRRKLLTNMEKLENEKRYAYFVCCTVLASPDGILKSVCATCEGRVSEREAGGGGFGYDPLFIKHGYGKTFAELNSQTKNRISARGKAIDKLLISLEELVS